MTDYKSFQPKLSESKASAKVPDNTRDSKRDPLESPKLPVMAISKDSATDYDPSREELEDLLERTAISSVKPDVQTGVEEASRELAKEGNIERGRNTELQIARPEIEPASPAFLELDDSWLDEWVIWPFPLPM